MSSSFSDATRARLPDMSEEDAYRLGAGVSRRSMFSVEEPQFTTLYSALGIRGTRAQREAFRRGQRDAAARIFPVDFP
jgi:hypothetical protein